MSNFRKVLFVIPFVLILQACQTAPQPTQVEPPPDNSASVSGAQATSSTGNAFDPSQPPVDVWREIPVMPKAIAGEEAGGMYGYKIDAVPDDIIAYYRKRLPPFQWVEGHYEPYSDGSALIIFTRGRDTLVILIEEANGLMLVFLRIQ